MTIVELYNNMMSMPRPDITAKNTVISDADILVELVQEQMQHGNRGGVRKETARLGWHTPKGGWKNDRGASEYAIKKNKMNPKPGLGVVDLKLTGSFYLDRQTLEVTSTDQKTDKLMEKYGKYIFKLTPESIQKYREVFNSKFRNAIMSGIVYGKAV